MERLSSDQLRREQEKTLSAPRMRYTFLARLLFSTMDLFYGRKKSLGKFKILEIVARVPYQAWENVAYVAMTHVHTDPNFARRIYDRVRESRQQQDNEQWHLLILVELTSRPGRREGFVKYWLIPQFLAFAYYHISWLLYVIKPRWSYHLNAEFEDHAEHEYMEFVAENPRLDGEPFDSTFKKEYGEVASMGDLFRQFGYDERVHKLESLERMEQPRFQ